MAEPWNPSEAQRKAMVDKLCEHSDCFARVNAEVVVDDMIDAANSIPEGAPVGTIARRPDGEFVAVRVLGSNGLPRWSIVRVDWANKVDETQDPTDADSWPVIFTPGGEHIEDVSRQSRVSSADLSEAVGSGPTTDGVGTYDPTKPQPCVVCGPVVVCEKCTDPTAQQEPEACESCLGSGIGLGKVLGGFLETDCGACDATGEEQQEPVIRGTVEDALRPDDVKLLETDPMEFVRRTRQPRVVDRLGVDEQGSRWARHNLTYWFEEDHWCDDNGDPNSRYDHEVGFIPGPGTFTEILEHQPEAEGESSPKSSPRVLPSLDCEEARDGTVWEDSDTGFEWRYRFTSEWEYSSIGFNFIEWLQLPDVDLLGRNGPFTEVLPDVG